MSGCLLLDTSVWIDAVDDASLLKRFRSAKYEIAIADEAVFELVARAVSAAHRSDDTQYALRRAACGQATAYSSVTTQPIGCHLANLLGLETGGAFDLRRIVREVSETRDAAKLRARFNLQARDGSSLHDWPESRDAQRSRFHKSIHSAFAALGVGGRRMEAAEYAMAKAQPPTEGNRALLRLEAINVRDTMGLLGRSVAMPDEVLVERLAPHLAVYLEIFREAYFDRYNGPHNDNARKVRFEEHDWNDLAQLRYVQESTIWVTSERVWPALAARTRFAAQVLRPQDVPL